MKFEHFPATWATFASQMGVFIAVGGVQRLIGISVPHALHRHSLPPQR